MKNVLNYQSSEYDCGPTTLINAVRYLFDREEIAPELLKAISLYTLDSYNAQGESGKSGTSRMAMQFLTSWMNQYGRSKGFPIEARFLETDQVYIAPDSEIVSCLQQKGVVIARVWLYEDEHYVLLTQSSEGEIGLFDPYFVDFSQEELQELKEQGVTVIMNEPLERNRVVRADVMNRKEAVNYAMGEKRMREAVLLYNSRTRVTPERSIEYII